jgi:ribosome-associated heat shock protein Hsp15
MAGRDLAQGAGAAAADRQRLDKWLWFARMVKTRALAAKLVQAGHVRLNGARASGPDKPVRPGDVLTIALERQVRVLRVESPGERRGPYEEARLLYTDLAPADAPKPESMD